MSEADGWSAGHVFVDPFQFFGFGAEIVEPVEELYGTSGLADVGSPSFGA
jgi:hypothetical protein